MTEQKQSFDFQTFKRLLRWATPYRLIFILSAVLAIVLAPLGSLRPFLINKMVDDTIVTFDARGMTVMALIIFGVLILESALRYFFIYLTNLLGQSIVKDLRKKVFDHIISLRLRFFDQTPIGKITTRTINDIESINTVFSQGMITIVADILGLIAVLIIMFYSSWRLSLICLTTMPILLFATYIFKEKVKKAYQIVRAKIAQMNAFLQERISGMRIIQIFNAEEQEMEKFKEINRDYTQANLDSILYYAVFFPVVDIISAVSLGLMVWWGARGVIHDDITLGALIAFPIYLSMLFRPLRFLADRFNTLQMGLVAAERVFNVLDTKAQIEDKGTLKPEKLKGAIAFHDVSFAYDDVNYVLNNITFHLEAGKTLALVGSTGSGKSTIINILNRFYEIQKGEITIDNANIREYAIEALRSRVSLVLQDVFLFAGSVKENITLRDPNISLDQVHHAAKLIGAHEFIERLPDGYQFMVNERGTNLSMGQRQLISFIRALVFDPDILILDEATSSVDTETEAIIQYAIEKLIEKRTSIIIAHRLSTIQHADKIIVLDKGHIAEEGSPAELLEKEHGHYRKLYDLQFLTLTN